MRRPLILLLTPMIFGIVFGYFFHSSNMILLISLLVVLSSLVLTRFRNLKGLSTILLSLCFFPLGVLNINLYLYPNYGPNHIIHYAGQDTVMIEGTIVKNPEVIPDKATIIISVNRAYLNDGKMIPAEGRVLLNVRNPEIFYKYGDYIRCKTRFRPPHNFENPGGFDYIKHLRFEGISVVGYIKDSSNIVVLRENRGNIFITTLERFRSKLKKIIRDNAPSPEGEIIQAMILGDQKEIPKDITEKFNATGTSHIIAISGFNIGMIAVLSTIIIRLLMTSSTYLLLRFDTVVLSTIFAMIPVIIYTFIAGMGMSVVRATIMAITFMVAVILGKEKDFYNILALAAFIILIFCPYALFDISFQLSFVAVWAIIFIAPRFVSRLPQEQPEAMFKKKILSIRTLRAMMIFLIVSLSAMLGTLPLIVLYFNRISSVALIANLFIVPVMGVVAIPVCLMIIISAPLSTTLSIFFVHLSSFLIWISVSMVDFFSSLPGASFFIVTPTLLELTLYYLLLMTGVMLLDFRNTDTMNQPESSSSENKYKLYRAAFVTILFIFICSICYMNNRDTFSNRLKVTYIDVGQGSSTLAQLPGGKTILIDGGGFPESNYDVGRYVVAPLLWHERINIIDIVVLTHPHPDHQKGLIYVLSHFKIGEVWTNGQPSEGGTDKEFMALIHKNRIKHRVVSEKTKTLKLNNVEIGIIHPEDMDNDCRNGFMEDNNRSIVMSMTFKNVKFLFPGDISETAENLLVRKHRHLNSQILLVPHHGGSTSSSEPFIRCVSPNIAVISCGTDNVYRFPHDDVLKRFSRFGIKIFRTDIHGAIAIETDGNKITPTFFKDRRM